MARSGAKHVPILLGARFGALELIDVLVEGRSARWMMRCDCGAYKEVARQSVTRGRTRSCGCGSGSLTSKLRSGLSAELLRQAFQYDPASGRFTRLVPVKGRSLKANVGKVGANGYLYVGICRRLYLAHRLAWLYHYGFWPNKMIDHIDGDKQNNAISNLREANATQNLGNSSLRSDNKTGIKGVCFVGGAYLAQISAYGAHRRLGSFPTKEQAAHAYREAAKKAFGDFARLA